MFNWVIVKDEEKTPLIEKANNLHNRPFFDDSNTYAEKCTPDFYDGLELLKLVGGFGRMSKTMMFLFNKDKIIKLNGDHASIYDANAIAKVKINEKTAFAYTKFFLESLITNNGEFKVVEDMKEVEFTGEPTKEVLDELPKLIKKATVSEKENGFELVLTVLYADTLYETKAFLHKNGKLELKEEKVLLEEVPTKTILLM